MEFYRHGPGRIQIVLGPAQAGKSSHLLLCVNTKEYIKFEGEKKMKFQYEPSMLLVSSTRMQQIPFVKASSHGYRNSEVKVLQQASLLVRLVVNDRKFSTGTLFFSHTKPTSSK